MIKAQAGTRRGDSKPASSPFIRDDTPDGKLEKSAADHFTACLHVVTRKTTPLRILSLPLEDQATYYFFYNFVSQDPASLQSYSHVMPTVYRQSSSFNALPNIIEAIGLAGVSNVKQAPQLMAAAGVKYAKALRAITASIQDSKEASTDQTLITVMLLGLFEVSYTSRCFLGSVSDYGADRHMFQSRVYEILDKSSQWSHCNSASTWSQSIAYKTWTRNLQCPSYPDCRSLSSLEQNFLILMI